MTLIESLTLAYDFLVLITLIVLVYQGILQRRASEMSVLESTYRHYFDIDRLAIDYPALQIYSARSDVQEVLSCLDEDGLRKRAYIELLFDVHELMFIKQRRKYYDFQEDYLKSLVASPHVREYWQHWRGNYISEFATVINRLVETAPATPHPPKASEH